MKKVGASLPCGSFSTISKPNRLILVTAKRDKEIKAVPAFTNSLSSVQVPILEDYDLQVTPVIHKNPRLVKIMLNTSFSSTKITSPSR
jgi:hypothetical protein